MHSFQRGSETIKKRNSRAMKEYKWSEKEMIPEEIVHKVLVCVYRRVREQLRRRSNRSIMGSIHLDNVDAMDKVIFTKVQKEAIDGWFAPYTIQKRVIQPRGRLPYE